MRTPSRVLTSVPLGALQAMADAQIVYAALAAHIEDREYFCGGR